VYRSSPIRSTTSHECTRTRNASPSFGDSLVPGGEAFPVVAPSSQSLLLMGGCFRPRGASGMPLPYGQAVPGWCTFHGWHPLACSAPKGVPEEANALQASSHLNISVWGCTMHSPSDFYRGAADEEALIHNFMRRSSRYNERMLAAAAACGAALIRVLPGQPVNEIADRCVSALTRQPAGTGR